MSIAHKISASPVSFDNKEASIRRLPSRTDEPSMVEKIGASREMPHRLYRSNSEASAQELPESSCRKVSYLANSAAMDLSAVPYKDESDQPLSPRATISTTQSWSCVSSVESSLLQSTSEGDPLDGEMTPLPVSNAVDGEMTPLPVSRPGRSVVARSWSSIATVKKRTTLVSEVPGKTAAPLSQCVARRTPNESKSKGQKLNDGQRQNQSEDRQRRQTAAHWGVGPPDQGASIKSFSRSQTLILFDWDDTLLPSSWLADCELTLDANSIPMPHERAYLDEIARSVCALLVAAVHCGRVVVVTNAESGWVDLSAAKFMPTVLETLRRWHISVISARTEFESVQRQHPVQWKVEAFRQLLLLAYPTMNLMYSATSELENKSKGQNQRSLTTKRRSEISILTSSVKGIDARTSPKPPCSGINVVSFGDSDSERIALIQCVRALNRIVEKKANQMHFYKSFKLCEHPTPMILHRQLQLVQRLLPQIIHHEGNLDLRVNFKVSSQFDKSLEEKAKVSSSTRLNAHQIIPMPCTEKVSIAAS